MLKQEHIEAKLKDAGLRPTRQRLLLGELLWKVDHRHVTAEQLHFETKEANMPVSLATVYNTLHQFTDAGLLKEISVDGSSSYFDTNIKPHYHLYHTDSGKLEDIAVSAMPVPNLPSLPKGATVESVDVVIRVSGAA